MSLKTHGKRVAKSAGQSVSQGAGYAAMAVETIPSPLALSKRSNVVLMFIGWSLLIVLIYLVIARKPIVTSIGVLGGLGGSAAKVWVAPVDPLAVLGAGSSSGSVPSSSSEPSQGGQSGGTGGSTGGNTSEAPPPGVAHPPPAPSHIARLSTNALERRYGSSAQRHALAFRASLTTKPSRDYYYKLRAQRVREGRLKP